MNIGIYISDITYRIGGTEANCAYIIYTLQKTFNLPEITIFSEKYNKSENYNLNIAKRFNSLFGLAIEDKNINLQFLFANKQNFIGRAIFENKLRKASESCEVFINCTMNIFSFRAKKNIAIIHFPPYRKTKSEFVRKFPIFWFSALKKDRMFFKSYYLYISYSQYVQYWLKKIWNIDDMRSVLVYPAVNLLKKLNIEKENIIYVCSRVEKSKEIEILISAFKSSEILQNAYKLIIAGSVVPETKHYADFLRELIGSQSDKIILHENPSYEDIVLYYNKAKIFWHAKGYSVIEENDPYELEHFGLTTVEAMSAGCVPVVINKGGQKEIVDEGINGFRWDTSQQLIDKTLYLLQHEDELKEMSKNAIEKAKNYSLECFVENFGKVLKSKLNA
jgi:glycosyltransferase involved in cell wall biosynthesis